MSAVISEWFNLLVRWVHVIAAIMWIGDSFLFMWLDSHLSTPREGRDGPVTGELWMTHSGGFYEVIKRKSLRKGEAVGPLYWFKWESYTTWLSGFLLLAIVYYHGASALLIDRAVADLSVGQAIGVSLGVLFGGYVVYAGLWRTPLKSSQPAFAAVGFGLILVLAYALTHLFSGRAAFLQLGATLATIMACNVLMTIIPAQRHMLAATEAGTPVDTSYGLRAKGRSIQNHYLTLPVLFMMLSNHFPSTYGHPQAWLVLGLLFVVGVGLKYVMNKRGQSHPLGLVVPAFALVGVIGLTLRPQLEAAQALDAYKDKPAVSFATVQTIVQTRCVTCHATKPTSPMFPSPPNGIVFETPENIAAHAERMFVRAVTTKTMPLGNITGMQDDERALLGAWIAQGKDVHATGPSAIAAPAPMADAGVVAEPTDPVELAALRFKNLCSTCHGANGDGQTPTAAALNPKPRNFTDAEWQKATSDDAIRKIILEGGPAVGKSPAMPANADLKDKPEVIDALLKTVRGFGGQR
jgi:uncharacterized membrane protein